MNRAGTYITNLTGDAAYKSFRPALLPPQPELQLDEETMRLLVESNRQLSRLDSVSSSIPSAELFVSMYVRKEALISSQIEGTQCTLDDVLNPDLDSNTNLDVADVINYVKAVQYALDRSSTLPLCNRLLCEIHEVLMEGVRGQEKNPGEFRRSQNWIGAANCALKDARFVPPNVDDMTEAISALEKYINENDKYDPLVRAALIHYQFETIHPFLDGNGRIGRLLILLYLMDKKLLSKPVLYVSFFLKKNQVEYYDRISEVRRSGNYEQWVRFFLEAVSKAAEDATSSIEKLTELHERNLGKLPHSSRSRNITRALFDYLEKHPIINVKKTAQDLGVSFNTATSAIRKLIDTGILKENTNVSRNRIFTYDEYLSILREGT